MFKYIKIQKRNLMAISLIIVTTISYADPSFNCQQATTNVEKLICGDKELSALDQTISNLFSNLSKTLTPDKLTELKHQQKIWLNTRNNCKDRACLRSIMEDRVSEKNGGLKDPVWGQNLKQKTFSLDSPWVDYYGVTYDKDHAVYLKQINELYNEKQEEENSFPVSPTEKTKYQNLKTIKDSDPAKQDTDERIYSCPDFHRLVEQQGYDIVASDMIFAEQGDYYNFAAGCKILDILKNIKPAKISYTRDFKWDEKAIDLLPAELMLPYEDNHNGINTIKDYLLEQKTYFGGKSSPSIEIAQCGVNCLSVGLKDKNPKKSSDDSTGDSDDISADIALIARGDLIGNGQEQLLFMSTRKLYRGIDTTTYFIVSRDKEADPLKVLKTIDGSKANT